MQDLLFYILVWLFVAPLVTIIHELGHAIVLWKNVPESVKVEIYIGATHSLHTFRLGLFKTVIILQPLTGFIGQVRTTKWFELSRIDEIKMITAGPLASIMSCIVLLASEAFLLDSDGMTSRLVGWGGTFAGIQFLASILPYELPSASEEGESHPSDSLRLYRVLKQRENT